MDFFSEEEDVAIPELDLNAHGRRRSNSLSHHIAPSRSAGRIMSGRQNAERVVRHSLRGAEEAERALGSALEAYSLRTIAVSERISSQDLHKLSKGTLEQLREVEAANCAIKEKLAELEQLMLTSRRALSTLTETLAVSKFERSCAGYLSAHKKRDLPAERKTKCIVCTDHTASIMIERHCQPRPGRPSCEKRACECGALLCRECLLHHYWVESNHTRKSYARCPHCRAEFCLEDLVEVRWVKSLMKTLRPPKPAELMPSVACGDGAAEAC